MLSLVQVTRLMASSQHCRNQLAFEEVRLRTLSGCSDREAKVYAIVDETFITVFNAI